MPELPEIETILQKIKPWVTGQVIVRTKVYSVKLRYPISERIKNLSERKVISLQRRAKYLLLELDQGWIIIHCGMSGYLQIVPESCPPKRHDHIDLFMSNKYVIRYNDSRRFGLWMWSHDPFTSRALSNLGIEPLSTNFNGSWLYRQSRNKRTSVKQLIMNNKIIAGIGNIYANESLFFANILPKRNVNSLNTRDTALIANSIKTVLMRAIQLGGTTIKNYVQPDGMPGYFNQELMVYGRANKPCRICKALICVYKQSQRRTFFCPQCQH